MAESAAVLLNWSSSNEDRHPTPKATTSGSSSTLLDIFPMVITRSNWCISAACVFFVVWRLSATARNSWEVVVVSGVILDAPKIFVALYLLTLNALAT